MNKIIYIPGTLLNILLSLYLIGTNELIYVLIFFIGILINQWMLLQGVGSMMSEKQNKSMLLVLKMFVLILIFIFAMIYLEEYVLFLTISYIFQLIILVLSIKRYKEKN